MNKVSCVRIFVAVFIFIFLAIVVFYFAPQFFIKEKGQFCLIDNHCKNINCEKEIKESGRYEVKPICQSKVNSCLCNILMGGGFLVD